MNFATCNVPMNPPGGRQIQFPLDKKNLTKNITSLLQITRNIRQNFRVQSKYIYYMIKELTFLLLTLPFY